MRCVAREVLLTTLEECYEKYHKLLWAIVQKDYSNLHGRYSADDLFAEAVLKLVEVYQRYGETHTGEDFRRLLVRSVHNRLRNLYDRSMVRKGEVLVDLLWDVIEVDGVSLVHEEDPLDTMTTKQLVEALQKAVAAEMGATGTTLLGHMLWSAEAARAQRISWLRRKHVIRCGVKARMRASCSGGTGMVSLEVLAGLMGCTVEYVIVLRQRIRGIARRVFAENIPQTS